MRRHFALALIFICLFSVSASGNSVFNDFKSKPATLKVLSKNSDVCSDGPLKFVGDVLMVGPVITMPLESETHDEDGCNEVSKVTVTPTKIENLNTISGCPKDQKNLEGTVLESVELKGKTLLYSRNKNVKCTFEWIYHEKK